MAMGGTMKGHSGGGNGNSGSNRGRQYGVILFLAFGAAIFGVMVLHKLRERRIFNLLVQEKDHQLLSLQIILQKERDYSKEAKRRTEEMKAKIYSMRTEKMELERKILEMQSTISSVKDEQKLMESTIREKLNEIKLLREKEAEPIKENPQVTALTESLKQKEAEIEDLKQHLKVTDSVKNEGLRDSSNKDVETESSGKNADEGLKEANLKETTSEDLQKKAEDSEVEDSAGVKVGITNANETTIGVLERSGNEDGVSGHTVGDKDSEGRESQLTRGGMKLELPSKSQSHTDLRARARHDSTSTSNEKKWRILARNRRRASNLIAESRGGSLEARQYHGDGQQNGRYKRLRRNAIQELDKPQGKHSEGLGIRKESDGVRQEGGEEGRDMKRAADSDDNEAVVRETGEKSNLRVVSEANETGEEKPGGNGQVEEQTGGVQQQIEASDGENVVQDLEREKVDEKYEEAEETVSETKTVERDGGSVAKVDEDQEDSGEETEETEF